VKNAGAPPECEVRVREYARVEGLATDITRLERHPATM
jgi:hypothetical protein